MGCCKSSSSTITLLAAAPNGKEALKVTGKNGQIINGSKWYRVAGHSFGFAPEDRLGRKHKISFCLLFYMGVVWEVLWLEFYIEK